MKTEDRWFEDYRVGESRTSVGRTITETDVVMHAGMLDETTSQHCHYHYASG